ncbi:hypothetical protein JCM14469_06940 [Desulfatiferula olefinivorans]
MSSRNKALLLSGMFSLFAVLSLTAVTAETGTKAPAGKQRPPVSFTHETHMGDFACLDCHHRYENGENVLDEGDLMDVEPDEIIMLNMPSSEEPRDNQCASCHNGDKKITKLSSRDALHRQCIGCHEEMAQGPVLCGECHVRSKQVSAEE